MGHLSLAMEVSFIFKLAKFEAVKTLSLKT